jgi:isopentenyldiphosphate isomerase
MEILARFNERDERIGEATRDDIHAHGYWHETFHCWFVGTKNGERIVYLQLRSADKKDYPSHYDITAAGHLLSTETVADGVREIAEEVGVTVTMDDLRSAGTIQNIVHTTLIDDREWARCYVYDVDAEPTFTLQREEVETLVTCTVSDFQALIAHTAAEIPITDVFTNTTATLTFDALVPHPQSYFEAIVKAL